MAEMTIEGVSAIGLRLRDISADMKTSLNNAIMEEAEAIAERSRSEFVPEESGALRDSIRVEKAGITQGRDESGRFTSEADITISIVAGGPGIDHAVAVHETPSQYDPPTWQGKTVQFTKGGSKYLEKPLFEAENGMVERIASKVRLV